MAVSTTGVKAEGSNNSNTTTVVTGAMSSATTAGNLLIAFITWDNGSSATISSLSGGGSSVTWTSKIAKTTDSRHGQNIQCYAGTVNTGGTTAVTCTFNTNCFAKSLQVIEVTGQHATQFDATGTKVTDAGTAVTQSITTTQTGCFVCGMCCDDSGANTITAPAGMTQSTINSGSGTDVALHYRTTNPGVGATSVDWTFSGTDDAISAGVSVAPAVTFLAGKPYVIYQAVKRVSYW